MEAYQNAALSPEERAKDLLGKMTLQENVGQSNQRLYGFRIYERHGEEFTLTEEFKEEVERMGGLGVLYGLYRADPWADKDEKTGIVLELSAKAYNIVQKYVIDHSRLGIPMMMSTECPHGHQALGGGLLPVNLAAGATFDPELLSEGYKACGKQLKSGHVDLALMSALDMARDPRWGRSEECYSEDPCLAASMAKAAVTGMQSTGVGSVAKHFCAQGETTGGVNASAARIGERELREIHFPSAKACCEAGVEGIMAAYNEIDGVYCHRNAWLLRDVLRGEMGFDGIVMADGLAVDFLKNTEGDTLHACVCLSLRAFFRCFAGVFLFHAAVRRNFSVSRSSRSPAASSSRSISRRKYALHSVSVIVHPPISFPRSSPAPLRSEWRGGRLECSCPSQHRTACLSHTPPFRPATAG